MVRFNNVVCLLNVLWWSLFISREYSRIKCLKFILVLIMIKE